MKKIILTSLLLLLANTFAYDFEYNNHKLNYDEETLKFYENNELLSVDEIKKIFPDYEIVLISQFGDKRKLRVKNSLFKSKKVLIYNDCAMTFYNFNIYPEASRYKDIKIKPLITIYGKKNVRLKHPGGSQFEITIR